jgi:hypothetical protein
MTMPYLKLLFRRGYLRLIWPDILPMQILGTGYYAQKPSFLGITDGARFNAGVFFQISKLTKTLF